MAAVPYRIDGTPRTFSQLFPVGAGALFDDYGYAPSPPPSTVPKIVRIGSNGAVTVGQSSQVTLTQSGRTTISQSSNVTIPQSDTITLPEE